MAISEDTVALLAAQLTAAWASRSGPREYEPSNPPFDEVLSIYEDYKAKLTPPSDRYNIDALL